MDLNKVYSAYSNGKRFSNSNFKNNNSSLYKNDVENKFNWGAFFFSWIWGIFNKSYITLIIFPAALLCFIPIVGVVVPLGLNIWFGICGNKWAWENGNYTSIETFHEMQKRWAIAGLVIMILAIIVSIIFSSTRPSPMIRRSTQTHAVNQIMEKYARNIERAHSFLLEAGLMSEATGNKCNGSSEELASCVAEIMDVTNQGNVISAQNANWEFHSDGYCVDETSCWVDVTFDDGSKSSLKVPFILNDGQIKPIKHKIR